MVRRIAFIRVLIASFFAFFIVCTYVFIHLVTESQLETMSVLTTNTREATLMLTGLFFILSGIILGTKGKEDWKHRFDAGKIERRPYLPKTSRNARYLLRETIERKIRSKHGLSLDEFDRISREELASMMDDGELANLLIGDDNELSQKDIRRLMEKIENL